MRYVDLTTGEAYICSEGTPRVFRSPDDGHIMARIVEAELDDGSVWVALDSGWRDGNSTNGIPTGTLMVSHGKVSSDRWAGVEQGSGVPWVFSPEAAVCIATPADAAQVLAEIRRLEAGAEPVEPAAERRARVCACCDDDSDAAMPHPTTGFSVPVPEGHTWHAHTCPARDIPDEPSAEPETARPTICRESPCRGGCDFDGHYEQCDTHGTPKGYWCVDCGEKRGDRRKVGGLSPADQAKADAHHAQWLAERDAETEPAPESEPTHYRDPYINHNFHREPDGIVCHDDPDQPYDGQAQRIAAILDEGFRLPWDPYED